MLPATPFPPYQPLPQYCFSPCWNICLCLLPVTLPVQRSLCVSGLSPLPVSVLPLYEPLCPCWRGGKQETQPALTTRLWGPGPAEERTHGTREGRWLGALEATAVRLDQRLNGGRPLWTLEAQCPRFKPQSSPSPPALAIEPLSSLPSKNLELPGNMPSPFPCPPAPPAETLHPAA